jgi:eukaryotic-like serine/threonine-protein kinase
MTMSKDPNLLFGVMAVQLKFVTPRQLMDASAAWSRDRGRPLRDHLLSAGALTASVAGVLDGLLAAKLETHQGNLDEALASLGGDAALQASFAESSILFNASAEPEAEAAKEDTYRNDGFESFGGESKRDLTRPPELRPVTTGSGEAEGGLESTDKLTSEHPGRYTPHGEHSRGGIGRILLAFDTHIGREIAIKELLTDADVRSNSLDTGSRKSKTSMAMNRFLREARITGQLEHPAIVPVYEVGQRTDGTIYYTMRFIRGKTLAHAIRDTKTYEERIALLPHFLNLVNAIRYAHSRSVIHRDLKPQNVMVGEFGETVVLDWGLAKVKGRRDARAKSLERDLELIKQAGEMETIQGVPIGTPAYMPPEQADGRIAEVDERSDIWSLGAVLYELLAGRIPFDGANAFIIMGRVLKDEPPQPHTIDRKASDELSAIAMKCLRKNTDERYQTADHLAKDVQAYLTGGLVSAFDYSKVHLFKRWLRKWWPVAGTAAAAIVALLTVFTWSYINISHQRDRVIEQQKAALQNIAEAYLADGKWAASEQRWGTAEIFFSRSLAMSDRVTTRYFLNYARIMPRVPIRLKYVFPGHAGKVNDVDISPDGRFAVSAGEDKIVRTWDLIGGKAVGELKGHAAEIKAVRYSPHGRFIASAAADGKVCIWDAVALSSIKCLTIASQPVNFIEFSPDGKYLAAAGDSPKVLVVDLAGKSGIEPHELEGHTDRISFIAFSPDGTRLATGSRDKTARVWDPATGKLLLTLTGPTSSVTKGIFISGDRLLASSFDRNLRAWDLKTGKLVFTHSQTNTPSQFLPTQDPNQLLIGFDEGFIRLLDLTQCGDTACETIRDWENVHDGQILQLIPLPGRNAFATLGADRKFKIWDPDSESPANTLEGEAFALQRVAVGLGGKFLVTGGNDGIVRAWSLEGDDGIRRLSLLKKAPVDLLVDPTGKTAFLARPDGKISTVDLEAFAAGPVLDGHSAAITAISLSADGKRLASAAKDKKVLIWDVASLPPDSHPVPLAGHTAHTGDVVAVAITPDGKRVLSAGADGKVVIYDVDAKSVIAAPGATVDASRFIVDVSPDGKLGAVGLSAGPVRVWELESGELRHELSGHPGGTRAVTFSPDGKVLATGGKDDNVMVWNTQTGERLQTLEGHKYWIRNLRFSPDGKYLLSLGSTDKIAIVWDASTWKQLCTYVFNDRPSAASWRGDSGLLAVGSRDSRIGLWDFLGKEGPQCSMTISMRGNSGLIQALAYLPTKDGIRLLAADGRGDLMLWPFPADILSEEPAQLYLRAQSSTGLSVEGMDLVPWQPQTTVGQKVTE